MGLAPSGILRNHQHGPYAETPSSTKTPGTASPNSKPETPNPPSSNTSQGRRPDNFTLRSRAGKSCCPKPPQNCDSGLKLSTGLYGGSHVCYRDLFWASCFAKLSYTSSDLTSNTDAGASSSGFAMQFVLAINSRHGFLGIDGL